VLSQNEALKPGRTARTLPRKYYGTLADKCLTYDQAIYGMIHRL
jgi:hypothetical protein